MRLTRRSRAPQDSFEAVDVLPPEPPRLRPVAPARRSGLDAVDAVEAEIGRAVRGIAGSAAILGAEAAAARAGLAAVGAHLGADPSGIAEDGRRIAEAADALADDATGIGAVLEQAGRHLDHAGESHAQARCAAGALADIADEIARAVDRVAVLAREANLLALHATIEAARLGGAGEGCARMARDAARLSAEGARAGEAIRQLGRRIESGSQAATEATQAAAVAIAGLRPVLATLQAASEGQAGRAGMIAGTARSLAVDAACIDEGARAAIAAADGAARHAAAAEAAAGDLARIGPRIVAAMRQAEIGDRRLHDRYPVDLPAWVGSRGLGRVLDLGAGGLLLAPPAGHAAALGASLALEVRGIGRLGVTVVGISPRGLHCAFAQAEDAACCAPALARIEEAHRPLVAAAQEAAAQVARALEGALAAGRLTRDALFGTAYAPEPGSDPPRFLSPAGPVLEEILPPLLEPLLLADERLVFCIAVDRNGYAPVHNRRFAQAPRPDDPAWTARHSRHRRFHDDAVGLAAARSMRAFLVQLVPDEGRGTPLREVSAPIRVHGRHWGGMRMAYRI
ncbi:methyl-accepting chemotaxis protein [Methylobacterium nodulans]|uniref:Methyl-accepting chemotaxis sensory transducer n=1 Tax=Methylobacterium nodulans (strain LMG 21967 / CNCM I-2342 / ORS 2060) TaxID=460265 RepID=B8IEX9_METNO|nr:methyl-accepting chemotaxis protein [Methylobacterium nodulans]ACL61472.1 methyl-accepting chemotaxis sensory transducer [Methylobacterium nodulans ORS 2060]